MALEIERRFLVTDTTWKAHVAWEATIRQGYLLSREDGLTTRVRLQELQNGKTQAWLTIKAPPSAGAVTHARWEFEYSIPVEDGHNLLTLCHWRLEKKRCGLSLRDGDWVLDIFEADNEPLIIAEVELKDCNHTPIIPSWCGQEITGMHQLSNASLARAPFRHWTEAQLLEVPTLRPSTK